MTTYNDELIKRLEKVAEKYYSDYDSCSLCCAGWLEEGEKVVKLNDVIKILKEVGEE